MRSTAATAFLAAFLAASPILASVSSPNYPLFELRKRIWPMPYYFCRQMVCDLEFCYNDDHDPWELVNTAMSSYYGADCGQFKNWEPLEPAERCDNGQRRGRATFQINRRIVAIGTKFDVSHNRTADEDVSPAGRGFVFGTCRTGKGVKCECNKWYNPEKRDCSAPCP
ncbi:hypothetical protein CTA1_9469 [Colletotrichum tanaceti]|uniref:Uncharacterized protein n=1 Tax=Colletotrichum tanaceti TaxID=1306861 RepID=A0A4U6X6K7_9PEZI|nr:hypothetical protein CTA1_9469 [Colletotrichum tanaceti]